METGSGILARVGEKVLAWIALGLLIALGVAIWRMAPATRDAIWQGIWRTALWIVIAMALPWAGRFFVRRILDVGANWAGVVLLAGYGLADIIAGTVLMKGLPSGGWGWLAGLAALATVATYNYWVTEYLAEQAGG